MYTYKHKKTGNVITTHGKVSGDDWEQVKAEKKAEKPKAEKKAEKPKAEKKAEKPKSEIEAEDEE